MAQDDQRLQLIGPCIAAHRLERRGIQMFLLRRHARQAAAIPAIHRRARAAPLTAVQTRPQDQCRGNQGENAGADEPHRNSHSRDFARRVGRARMGPQ
jgi:hypothetical protein